MSWYVASMIAVPFLGILFGMPDVWCFGLKGTRQKLYVYARWGTIAGLGVVAAQLDIFHMYWQPEMAGTVLLFGTLGTVTAAHVFGLVNGR